MMTSASGREIDLSRHLEARQRCLAVRDEIDLADRLAGLQRHGRHDNFTPLGVGRAHHRGHMNGGVPPVENFFDVVREDILTDADNHVLLAIDDVEEALLIEAAHVTKRKETPTSRAGCRLGVVEIFTNERGAADMNFADIALRHGLAFLVAQLNEHANHWPPNGTNLALLIGWAKIGDETNLGTAIEFIESCFWQFLDQSFFGVSQKR